MIFFYVNFFRLSHTNMNIHTNEQFDRVISFSRKRMREWEREKDKRRIKPENGIKYILCAANTTDEQNRVITLKI